MFLQSPCSTPLISSDEENWTPPSAVAGDVKRKEDKNVISLVPISVRPKFSFPTNIPRIKDFRKKKATTMKFKSAGSDPKLRGHVQMTSLKFSGFLTPLSSFLL